MALTKISGSILKDPLNLGEVSIGGTLTYQDVTNVDSVGIITARSTIDAQGDVSIADKIIHTGDTNTAIRFPAVDTISFETSGSERARISSNGKLGVGINDPQNYFSSYNNLVVGKSSDTGGITIVSASGSGGSIAFAKGTSGNQAYRGIIRYDQANDSMTFGTDGGTERLRITSAGRVGIGTDNPACNMHLLAGNDRACVRLHNTYPTPDNVWELQPGISGVTNTGFCIRDITDSANRFVIDGSGNVGVNTDFTGSQTWRNGQRLEIFGGGGNVTGELHLGANRGDVAQSVGSINFFDNTQDSTHRHIAIIEADKVGSTSNKRGGDLLFYTKGDNVAAPTEKFRITSEGKIGINASTPSAYARVHIEDANGILLAGNGQSRILLRNNTGGTNEKMMDIQCNGNINFRTINDDYTTATTRATFRTDGNFVVGNRVGTSSPSTNQPVAFHSARVTPDTASSTLSNGVRCNLYVGSNSGWQAGDGGVIGMGGSRAGYAGQEAMWAYIKGSRVSGNGWEYAGKMELGTAEWGTYNTTKAVTIYADNQIDIHGKDNTMISGTINGAVRFRLQHSGNNMTISNPSAGNFTFDTSSDYRLKENVVNITNALTTVKALKPYQYKWKHDGKLGQGFIAHEAQEVLPDVGIVSGTKDAVHAEDDPEKGHWKKDDPIYQGIDYSKLVPLLTAALQEETAKREALEARVAALEGS